MTYCIEKCGRKTEFYLHIGEDLFRCQECHKIATIKANELCTKLVSEYKERREIILKRNYLN